VTTSALMAAILIIVLFVTVWWRLESVWLIGTIFSTSMRCLIGALTAFLKDIQLGLAALKLELSAGNFNTGRQIRK
jgi:hypothetical protein